MCTNSADYVRVRYDTFWGDVNMNEIWLDFNEYGFLWSKYTEEADRQIDRELDTATNV